MVRDKNPLERLTGRAAREHRPLAALLELTYRCNLRCEYCYNDREHVTETLDTEKWIGILAQIAEIGVFHLALSGGEPLMHPGFDRILGEARRLGFATRVKTSGDLLTRERARAICEIGDPFLVELSLHGADAATHDRQTRVRGSFTRLVEHAEAARAEGLRVRLVCTLTRWNENQLDEMAALAASLDVPLRFSAEVAPRDNGDRAPLEIKMTPEGYRRYRRWLAERRDVVEDALVHPDPGEVERTCGAAATGFAVDPTGNVLPCVQWRQSAGNLLQEPLSRVWETSPVLLAAREVVRRATSRLGPGDSACRFCPGMAWVQEGDPMAEYRNASHPLGLQPLVAKDGETL